MGHVSGHKGLKVGLPYGHLEVGLATQLGIGESNSPIWLGLGLGLWTPTGTLTGRDKVSTIAFGVSMVSINSKVLA